MISSLIEVISCISINNTVEASVVVKKPIRPKGLPGYTSYNREYNSVVSIRKYMAPMEFDGKRYTMKIRHRINCQQTSGRFDNPSIFKTLENTSFDSAVDAVSRVAILHMTNLGMFESPKKGTEFCTLVYKDLVMVGVPQCSFNFETSTKLWLEPIQNPHVLYNSQKAKKQLKCDRIDNWLHHNLEHFTTLATSNNPGPIPNNGISDVITRRAKSFLTVTTNKPEIVETIQKHTSFQEKTGEDALIGKWIFEYDRTGCNLFHDQRISKREDAHYADTFVNQQTFTNPPPYWNPPTVHMQQNLTQFNQYSTHWQNVVTRPDCTMPPTQPWYPPVPPIYQTRPQCLTCHSQMFRPVQQPGFSHYSYYPGYPPHMNNLPNMTHPNLIFPQVIYTDANGIPYQQGFQNCTQISDVEDYTSPAQPDQTEADSDPKDADTVTEPIENTE